MKSNHNGLWGFKCNSGRYPFAVLIFGICSSFLIAVGLHFGWTPRAFDYLFSSPLVYDGDGLQASWIIVRIIEGWVYTNSRSGHPFGSEFYDFPGSETGNYLIIKALSFFNDDYVFVLNAFVILSFPVVFAASFFAAGGFALAPSLSFAAAFLFTFLPFHFLRTGHTFYMWYFVVPIYFYFSYRMHLGFVGIEFKNRYLRYLGVFLILLISASFGVYFALFGCLVIIFGGVTGLIRSGRLRPLYLSIFGCLSIAMGVAANLIPNSMYTNSHGENAEVAQRAPAESEIYGLKPIQLVLPRTGHRLESFRQITDNYNRTTPLVNENTTASLGLVGTLGLLITGVCLLVALFNRSTDQRILFVGALICILLLFGVIGGLGSLFAHIVSPSIRAWNRISVVIAFGCIVAVLILLQVLSDRIRDEKRRSFVRVIAALFLCGVGFWDQTVSACTSCLEGNRQRLEIDRQLIATIERQLPSGAGVYQLPYMPYPEVPPVNRLGAYDLAIGFLHSDNLGWSFGGMKGREGDRFYRALAKESVARQVEIVSRLGLSGIYVDRRGYPDNGAAVVKDISNALGYGQAVESQNGEKVFFRLVVDEPLLEGRFSASELFSRSGFVVDSLGVRYDSTLAEGINFSREQWPSFIKGYSGLSGWEPWGRWSDASLQPVVRLEFFEPLPAKFNLILQVQSFGPNVGENLAIVVSDKKYFVKLPLSGEISISVDNVRRSSFLELRPPRPTSPSELGISNDDRKLGIGLVSLKIEELS
jgi:phosphoglycerol transferase